MHNKLSPCQKKSTIHALAIVFGLIVLGFLLTHVSIILKATVVLTAIALLLSFFKKDLRLNLLMGIFAIPGCIGYGILEQDIPWNYFLFFIAAAWSILFVLIYTRYKCPKK